MPQGQPFVGSCPLENAKTTFTGGIFPYTLIPGRSLGLARLGTLTRLPRAARGHATTPHGQQFIGACPLENAYSCCLRFQRCTQVLYVRNREKMCSVKSFARRRLAFGYLGKKGRERGPRRAMHAPWPLRDTIGCSIFQREKD